MSKSPNDIATKQSLLRYLKGEMSDREAHAFEKAALDDPFLADALEGYENMSPAEVENDINDLEKRLASQKRPAFVWYAAAVITLLVVSTFTWNYLIDSEPETISKQYEKSAKDSTGANPKSNRPNPVSETSELSEATTRIEEIESEKMPDSPVAAEESTADAKTEESETFEIKELRAPISKQNPELVADAEVEKEIIIEPLETDTTFEEIADNQVDMSKKREEAYGLRSAVQPAAAAASVADVAEDMAPARSLSGIVISEDGDPLRGVNVVVKNTSRGTVTDIDGQFNLKVDPADDALVASFIGMNSSEVLLDGSDSLTITLQEDVSSLSEVVVVGYGTQEALSDQSPGPLGGMSEFRAFVEKNIVNPDDQQGKVVLKVSLDESGSITDVEAKRTLSEAHTREAIRLVKEYRGFQPAIREGQAYATSLRIRIKFE